MNLTFHSYLTLITLTWFMSVGFIRCSASTDSATIRAIETEIRRLKSTSESIAVELKKQKEGTIAIQNEFKWLHNELKAFKKSLSDIETFNNQTVHADVTFIREKVTELTNFIFKVGKPPGTAKVNATTTPSTPTTSSTTKKSGLLKVFS